MQSKVCFVWETWGCNKVGVYYVIKDFAWANVLLNFCETAVGLSCIASKHLSTLCTFFSSEGIKGVIHLMPNDLVEADDGTKDESAGNVM